MENGKWRMENGKWRMQNVEWEYIAVGIYQIRTTRLFALAYYLHSVLA
jgi:hypothetical protein